MKPFLMNHSRPALVALLVGLVLTTVTVAGLTAVCYVAGYPLGAQLGKRLLNLDLVQTEPKAHTIQGRFFWRDPDTTSMFPFSVQTITYVPFFTALALLWARARHARQECRAIEYRPLPDDERVLIQPADIPDWNERIKATEGSIIGTMATRALLQYQSTNSTAESAAMVNATAEVAHNQSEAGYSLINYLAWSIPSLGFVGTVLGIGSALADFGISGASGPPLDRITANLGSAFDTTLVALLLSLVLMYIIHTVQAMEDRVINTAHEYCLANLVNRLFNPDQLTQ